MKDEQDGMQEALARIDFAYKNNSAELDLSKLNIAEIPGNIKKLSHHLTHLNCCYTQISNLSPLASLTELEELDCSWTNVSDLSPLASLTALQYLDFRKTDVSDLSPLASLTALKKL